MIGEYVGLYILLGGIALSAVIITTLDWWGQRRHDREHKQRP